MPLSPRVRRDAERTIAKARAKGHIRSLDKLTERSTASRGSSRTCR